MSQQYDVEMIDQETQKGRTKFEQLSDEALHLRTVENFLSRVEKAVLRRNSVLFNVDSVQQSLRVLKIASEGDSGCQAAVDAEYNVAKELQLWRDQLESKDRGIKTFQMRGFCDSSSTYLTPEVHLSLARLYVELPESPACLSKFDLFMTRAFEGFVLNTDKNPREFRVEMKSRVRRLYEEWGVKIVVTGELSRDVVSAASLFDEFTKETGNLSSFEGMVENHLFEKIRILKRELGSLFYEPAVVSSAVVCNLAFKTVFCDLGKSANEDISAVLNSKFDFPGAFLDPSSESQAHVASALRELNVTDFRSPGTSKPQHEDEAPTTSNTAIRGPGTSPWLIMATVIITLVCGSIFLFSGVSNHAAALSDNMEEVGLSLLPFAEEHFEVMYRQNTTLFVTAKSSWEKLPESDKENQLQKLLSLNAKKQLQAVVVIDSNARPLGEISESGLNIFNEPPLLK